MTLEQAGLSALDAASHGDLEDLQVALDARAAAFVLVKNDNPSPELHARLAAASEIGDSIRYALRSFQQRIAGESSRLSQIQSYSR